jgi:hypothetical protein
VSRVLHFGDPGKPWSTGSAQYCIEHDASRGLLVVAARCKLGGQTATEYALVDTGAQWSLIGGDVADALGAEIGEPLEAIRMQTRFGVMTGCFHRVEVTLLADEGDDLLVPATVMVAPDWPGAIVLGYRGLLERVRLALDPGDAHRDPWLFFGTT